MARAWHLKSRPQGMPTARQFRAQGHRAAAARRRHGPRPQPWLSVDPYMRGRMNDVKSYVPPFQLGEPMEGGAIGEVVESNADGFAPGDLVQHMAGWRDEAVVPARAANKLPDLGAPPEQFLGVLGVTGATAYFGLLDAAEAKRRRYRLRLRRRRRGRFGGGPDRQGQRHDGHRLGRRAGQMRVRPLARRRPGRRLQGRPDPQEPRRRGAGRDRRLFRQCRRRPSRCRACARAEPRALRDLRDDRGLQCDASRRAFRFIMRIIAARIRLQGFIVFDYFAAMGEFYRDMGAVARERRGQVARNRVEGLESMPDAFLGLFEGANTGKDAGPALEALQTAGSPLLQAALRALPSRCAEVPWVKLSGTTVPCVCFCSVSSPIASAARMPSSKSPGSITG